MRVKRPTYEELERMVEKLKKESHVRTQTEKTMRESEKLYRFLTENTSDVITRHLPDSTYLYISPACRTLFGYTPEKLLGTKAFALIHPEDVERVITIFQEVFKTGELRREQYRHLKKDGQYIWVETVGKVIKNELTGNIEDIICVVRDITERKRIEKVLKASEEKYRTLAENSTDAILMADKERKIVSCNQAVYKLFGYDKDEVDGKSAKIFHPSDESFNAYGELVYPIVNKTGFFRTEWNFMRKDGTVLPVELGTSAIKSSDGSITGFVVVIRDITEHKQAEEESKKYQTLFETSNDAIMMLDHDGKFFDGNKSAFELFGFSSKEDFINTHPSNFSPPTQPDGKDSFSASLEHIKTAIAKGIDFFAWVHKKADGTLFPAEVKLSRLPLGEGVVLQALVRDITERKQAEETLRESEERYRSLAFSVDLMYLVDRDCRYLFMNEGHRLRFGIPLEEIIGRRYDDSHSEEDSKEFAKKVKEVLETGKPIQHEHKSKRDERYFLRTFSPVKDLDERITAVTVVSKDITERKQAEEEREKLIVELRASLEKVKMLSGLLPICASCKKIRDDNGYWNQIDSYIRDHSAVEFSHGICPECMKKLYPDFEIVE